MLPPAILPGSAHLILQQNKHTKMQNNSFALLSLRRAKSTGGPRAARNGQGLQAGAGQTGRRRHAHCGVYRQIQNCECRSASAVRSVLK